MAPAALTLAQPGRHGPRLFFVALRGTKGRQRRDVALAPGLNRTTPKKLRHSPTCAAILFLIILQPAEANHIVQRKFNQPGVLLT